MFRPRHLLAALAMCLLAATLVPATAAAGACGARSTRQAFAPWGDANDYFRIPNGGFESGTTSWQVSGGSVVTANAPWRVFGSADARALRIPAGASATSASFCVAWGEGTVRLFVHSAGVSVGSSFLQVRLTTALNGATATAVHAIDGSAPGWRVSPPLSIPMLANPVNAPSQSLAIAFSQVGTPTTYSVDDVAVDPLKCC